MGRHVSPPSLRRRTEQALATEPAGLTWGELLEAVGQRAAADGGPPPTGEDVVRELGLLIVDGRVDLRDGHFVLRTRPRQAA